MVTATGELSNYFEGFDQLPVEQQHYIGDSLKVWLAAGYVEVLANHAMTARIGSVRYDSPTVDPATGRVTLNREELETELVLFQKFGPLAKIPSRTKGFVDARLNLVVAHEMAHQIWLMLSAETIALIEQMHRKRLEKCDRIHPLPDGYDGKSELVTAEQLNERVFLTGHSRFSAEEYFAESFAAVSMESSRAKLKAIDAEILDLLRRIVYSPDEVLDSDWHEQVSKSQAERRQRQQLNDTLLD